MTEQATEPKAIDATAQPGKAPALKAILAKKIGMTRVYNPKGEFIPVTVLESAACRVVRVVTQAKNGYEAVQLGLGDVKAKNINKPESGHFAATQVPPSRWLREFRVPKTEGFTAGQTVHVDQFAAGDAVDVTGVIKGKGFAGAVKRHRFKGGPKTHGQSDRWRAPGSSGRERVWPGKRGPGHMGAEWKTVQRLEVVSVDLDQNLLLLRGSVPGPDGTCVSVYQTTRPRRAKKVVATAAAKKAAKAPAKAAKPEKK